MVSINEIEIVPKRFPDGTYCLLDFPMDEIDNTSMFQVDKNLIFDWNFESEEETILLWYLIHHCREHYAKYINYILNIKYLPGARMDRVKSCYEVFTLKHFAKLINLMNFDSITLFDPHSNVGTAMLNGTVVYMPKYIVKSVFTILKETPILYFPDEGAMKRYKEMFPELPFLYGEKNRDWKTGKILGLNLRGDTEMLEKLENPKFLMIDDICSYGGTFYYSAKALKDAFPNSTIFSFATHTENEFPTLQKAFDERLIEKHFTSSSIYKSLNNKIDVIC